MAGCSIWIVLAQCKLYVKQLLQPPIQCISISVALGEKKLQRTGSVEGSDSTACLSSPALCFFDPESLHGLTWQATQKPWRSEASLVFMVFIAIKKYGSDKVGILAYHLRGWWRLTCTEHFVYPVYLRFGWQHSSCCVCFSCWHYGPTPPAHQRRHNPSHTWRPI